VPLKRLGKAEEVAQLALFLATDASSYISGNSIDIAGGF
jgi:3-oxoacyl-[acyl-carrier protein] reductase